MVVGEIAENVDLLVVGGGPGGYSAALRAADLGRRVTLVDRGGAGGVGGVCLHVGCIPSKALIEVAHAVSRFGTMVERGLLVGAPPVADLAAFQVWKQEVVDDLTAGVRAKLSKAAVDVVAGELRFSRPDQVVIETPEGQARFLQFRDVVISTGSRPVALPDLPLGDDVLDSTGALALAELPTSVAVVGGGYIGIEIGTALARLGARVTIVEATDRLLPLIDESLVRPVQRRLRDLGVEVLLGATARDHDGKHLLVSLGTDEVRVDAEKVVVAVGRRPNTDDLGLDLLGVPVGSGGLLDVGPDRRVSAHVAAIGDVTPGPALAHKAYAEADVAVDTLCGVPAAFDPAGIPAVVFSDPEIATVGVTATEVPASGGDLVMATIPMAASGRARTLDERAGQVQVVVERATNAVVGVHVVGPHASELIAEGVLAIEMAATPQDLAATIHPHPTLQELLQDAGRALAARTRPGGRSEGGRPPA